VKFQELWDALINLIKSCIIQIFFSLMSRCWSSRGIQVLMWQPGVRITMKIVHENSQRTRHQVVGLQPSRLTILKAIREKHKLLKVECHVSSLVTSFSSAPELVIIRAFWTPSDQASWLQAAQIAIGKIFAANVFRFKSQWIRWHAEKSLMHSRSNNKSKSPNLSSLRGK